MVGELRSRVDRRRQEVRPVAGHREADARHSARVDLVAVVEPELQALPRQQVGLVEREADAAGRDLPARSGRRVGAAELAERIEARRRAEPRLDVWIGVENRVARRGAGVADDLRDRLQVGDVRRRGAGVSGARFRIRSRRSTGALPVADRFVMSCVEASLVAAWLERPPEVPDPSAVASAVAAESCACAFAAGRSGAGRIRRRRSRRRARSPRRRRRPSTRSRRRRRSQWRWRSTLRSRRWSRSPWNWPRRPRRRPRRSRRVSPPPPVRARRTRKPSRARARPRRRPSPSPSLCCPCRRRALVGRAADAAGRGRVGLHDRRG